MNLKYGMNLKYALCWHVHISVHFVLSTMPVLYMSTHTHTSSNHLRIACQCFQWILPTEVTDLDEIIFVQPRMHSSWSYTNMCQRQCFIFMHRIIMNSKDWFNWFDDVDCAEFQSPAEQQLAAVYGVFPELAAGVGTLWLAVAHPTCLPVLPVLTAPRLCHTCQPPQQPQIGV